MSQPVSSLPTSVRELGEEKPCGDEFEATFDVSLYIVHRHNSGAHEADHNVRIVNTSARDDSG